MIAGKLTSLARVMNGLSMNTDTMGGAAPTHRRAGSLRVADRLRRLAKFLICRWSLVSSPPAGPAEVILTTPAVEEAFSSAGPRASNRGAVASWPRRRTRNSYRLKVARRDGRRWSSLNKAARSGHFNDFVHGSISGPVVCLRCDMEGLVVANLNRRPGAPALMRRFPALRESADLRLTCAPTIEMGIDPRTILHQSEDEEDLLW